MGQIEEVFDDLKDTLGKKGWLIFIGVAVVFFLYNLVKGSGETEDDLVPVTMVGSYPDAVTNADVIIDSIQNSIDYSEGIILDHITDTSQATNDYISEGLDSQNKLLEENFDNLQGGLTDHDTNISSGITNITENQTQIQESITEIKNDLNNVTKPATTTKPSTSSTKKTTSSAKKTTSNTYTYKTKSGLNTSTSIVDALKATGADSSFANRKKIAEANGIKNYTGSASQNVSLLNKLKSGTLKKV